MTMLAIIRRIDTIICYVAACTKLESLRGYVVFGAPGGRPVQLPGARPPSYIYMYTYICYLSHAIYIYIYIIMIIIITIIIIIIMIILW